MSAPTRIRHVPASQQPARPAVVLLGRYRVLQTNTEGGFGTVSVCWDSRLQRRVAIKRMPLRVGPGAPGQASTIDEALAEARTSSMLAHPNIVRMYDFEADERYSYLVMEYVDGLNLADLLARVEGGVLTFDECAHVIDCMASALAYAHENGVLHLDIKPANIMIDRSGTVKLGDFGMASLASAAGYGGARGGTVGYMPPEQIEGDLVDERTDIFSLAVVVWQALTGSCPYAAPTPEQSLKLINKGPSPALSRMEPQLAGLVEETLLRALDPTPGARMPTVESFARDLVQNLGDSHKGAESLRDLLNQAERDDEPRPQRDWQRLNVPLRMRYPWLGGACTRMIASATAAWTAAQTIPLVLPDAQDALVFGVVGVAASTAAWPPLGGLFGIVGLVAAFLANPSTFSFPLALLTAVMGIGWWIAVGRRSHFAGTALLLPGCLASPFAGVGLAGFVLGPGPAFLTGAGGWLLYRVFTLVAQVGPAADTLAGALVASAHDAGMWMLALGCGTASLVASLFASRSKTAFVIVGQVFAIAVLGLAQAMCGHMENGDIAAALDVTAMAVAVTLGVALSIVSILVGGGIQEPEG